MRAPVLRLPLACLLLLATLGARAAEPPASPFERPPGLSDGDWKALSQVLAKNVVPDQTLRPQDEASFGQGDGTTFMQFGRSFAVSGTTLAVGAPEAVSCVLVTSSCGGGVGAVYVYERVGGNWQFRQKLRASDYTYSTTTNRGFGGSVAVDGDTLLVGAGRAFDEVVAPSNAIGAVYVFTRTAGTWTETQKLLPPTPVPGTDEFGFSVALSGNTAVIGNPGRTVSGAARAGAVHVFTRSGGSFSQAALLTAADGATGNRLGESVAYSGTTILAGAPLGDAPTPADSGAAYVFTGSGATWTEQAKLVAGDPLAGARFGNAVDLDGDSAVIGAVGWTSNQGKAYVFVRSGTTWAQQQRLDAGDTQPNRLGASVSIRGDTVAVGAPDTRGTSGTPGAVRLFARSGGTWTLEQTLAGPDQTNAGIGVNTRLFDDGGTPALLASTNSSLPGSASGVESVRTFRRTGSAPTPFVLAGDLNRLPSTTQAFFGAVIAVDGDLAVVGVPAMQQPTPPLNPFNRVGAAYVYARSGSQWTLRQALTITPLGGDAAAFGTAVAISGNTIAIGAPGERAALSGSGTGAAYVYTVGPASIDLQQRIPVDNVTASNQAFGRSLSLDGDTLAVGAPFTSNPGLSNNFGRVFVYTRSGSTWTKQQEIVDAAPPGTADDFGNYVIMRSDALVIGTRRAFTSGYVPYVAVATRSGTTWSIVQRILQPPGTNNGTDTFGQSLAWSGTTLAIGARTHGTEASASSGNGRVYVYDGTPGSFALAQTLRQADDTTNSTSSAFGAALALSGDRLLVGAPSTTFVTGGSGPLGALYAFERVAGTWRQAARIRPAAPDNTVFGFGGPLTSTPQGGSPLAFAGAQALVGIPLSNGQAPFAAQNVGAAAVFAVPRATTITLGANPTLAAVGETVSARWTLSSAGGAPGGDVTVVASSGETCTGPAASGVCTLTFTRTGLRLLTAIYAGAPGFGQARSGAVSVGVTAAPGGLVGDDPVLPPLPGTAGGELIGFSVAMNESLIVVGAPGAGPRSIEGPGAVYVFAREGAPTGTGGAGLASAKVPQRLAVLTDAAGADGHRFGQSVAISADGSRIAVGAPAAGNGLGRAVVFLRGGAAWTDRSAPDQVLVVAPAAGETVQRFGETIDLDAAGNVVVGAPRTDRTGATDAGSAYVFDATGIQRAALAAATPAANELFGSAVGIDNGLLVAGVPGSTPPGGSNRGSVATWTFDGTVATPGAVLTASDAANNHRFGTSLALAGELLAVGAPGRNSQRGGGYVFRRTGNTLAQVAVLAPDTASGVNQAGASVAV
ncbi:MAG: FG-GAP repeat protein, partial [Xanthomonadaceae bacterium]|nr:FG-GAP repeat protein [Xanthomonadaceae bacterium]